MVKRECNGRYMWDDKTCHGFENCKYKDCNGLCWNRKHEEVRFEPFTKQIDCGRHCISCNNFGFDNKTNSFICELESCVITLSNCCINYERNESRYNELMGVIYDNGAEKKHISKVY